MTDPTDSLKARRAQALARPGYLREVLVDDVVVVASVSCIYGIGSPETYSAMTVSLPDSISRITAAARAVYPSLRAR